MELFVGIILIIVGIVNALFPKQSWLVEGGFLLKKRSPSETTLKTRRITGSIMIIVGIFVAF